MKTLYIYWSRTDKANSFFSCDGWPQIVLSLEVSSPNSYIKIGGHIWFSIKLLSFLEIWSKEINNVVWCHSLINIPIYFSAINNAIVYHNHYSIIISRPEELDAVKVIHMFYNFISLFTYAVPFKPPKMHLFFKYCQIC